MLCILTETTVTFIFKKTCKKGLNMRVIIIYQGNCTSSPEETESAEQILTFEIILTLSFPVKHRATVKSN